MVEFALCVPVLAIVVFATVDVARAYMATVHLKNSAREGAYFAATQPYFQTSGASCAKPDDIQDRVLEELGNASSDVTVTVTVTTSGGASTVYSSSGAPNPLTCSTASVSGATIKVAVTDNKFALLTPIAKAVVGNVTLTGSATVQELG